MEDILASTCLRRRKTKEWILWSFLEEVTEEPWNEIHRKSVEQRLKERLSRDCLTLESTPYTVTKPRH